VAVAVSFKTEARRSGSLRDPIAGKDRPMKPRISVLTLGVGDLERSLRFYRDGLGLPTRGIVGTEFEHGAVAFFDLQPDTKLALFGRGDLARDAGLPGFGPAPGAFSLGHNVGSRDEVDAVMRQAEQAGATMIKPAQATFWGGYAGYFADPDGHLWEIVYNPGFIPQA
jgi:catechol 2,3-dioxygenase-like lactoylglutathione lyase family enzyme